MVNTQWSTFFDALAQRCDCSRGTMFNIQCSMFKRLFPVVALLLAGVMAAGAQQEDKNQFSMSLNMLGHGELRDGGFTGSEGTTDNSAQFLMERTRLILEYKRPHLETKVTAQHSGIWGEKGRGSFNLNEAWAKLSTNNGFFAQMGRQVLAYDDERIIGSNDWAMASLSHDVLRMGYEGYGHKAHAIFAFNQNAENVTGGTYYENGSQPYKIMHTLWYHYDVPRIPIGVSLLFMNIGMQGGIKGGIDYNEPRNRYQQLLGGFLSFKPGILLAEASYYHQMGRNENNGKIDAWMAAIKTQLQVSKKVGLVAGYDYMSGDDYFAIRAKGTMGVPRHEVYKGFNPVYGSHHKFYGMMDFFYVQSFTDDFSPGLQNLYAGATYSPIKNLHLRATYHYMAITTKLEELDMTLGHDIDIEASYQFMKDVGLSLGFSYMVGTETMQKLKRADKDDNLKWGWFSLVVSPRLFTTKW